MKKMITKASLAVFFFAVSTVLGACAPQQQKDCGFVQNIYGQRISWKKNLPIPLVLHKSVPESLRPAVYRAIATWETTAGRKLFEVFEDSSQIAEAPSRDKKNAIYFLSEWESDRTSEQGRTSVYWAGDQIQEADIRINAHDFSYYDQSPQQLVGSYGVSSSGISLSEGYSFEALILHELGHFLGLKHREGETVMATHLAAYSDRVALAAVDQESLSCEYK